MSDVFSRLAEIRISEAVNKGDLKDLPGQGKPLELEPINPLVPPEERMFFKILKNLGLEPVEVSLLKEIENLREKIAKCDETAERNLLEQELRELKIKYNIIMEARRRKR